MFRSAWGLSIALHLSLLTYLFLGTSRLIKNSGTEKFSAPTKSLAVRPVSEEDLDREIAAREKKRNTEQIVRADEQLRTAEIPHSKTEKIFRSQHNQRVDRNQRSERVGEFKNVLEEGLESGDAKTKTVSTAQPSEKRSKRKAATLDPKDLFALSSDGENQEQRNADSSGESLMKGAPKSILADHNPSKKGRGLSATDDYLPGIALGANTLLNTQEFKFYGFYERVRKLLVDRWRMRIRREIARARRPSASGDGLSVGSKVTKLQVKLSALGEITAIQRVGISGIESFDRTAEISFREAAPFPHPPTDMLKDGELTILWDFVVVVEDASLVEFKVSRSL